MWSESNTVQDQFKKPSYILSRQCGLREFGGILKQHAQKTACPSGTIMLQGSSEISRSAVRTQNPCGYLSLYHEPFNAGMTFCLMTVHKSKHKISSNCLLSLWAKVPEDSICVNASYLD